MNRFKYDSKKVVDAEGPEFARRNFLEQQCLVDAILARTDTLYNLVICEIGAGYGRMTQCLEYIATDVHAFEREESLVQIGKALNPKIKFHQVETLSKLPAEDSSFDAVVTWTCLQHLQDDEFDGAIGEIKRLVRLEGYAFICEETDPNMNDMVDGDYSIHGTKGRDVSQYQAALGADFKLVRAVPRPLEPTYSRANNAGTLMVFQRLS